MNQIDVSAKETKDVREIEYVEDMAGVHTQEIEYQAFLREFEIVYLLESHINVQPDRLHVV